MLRDAPVPAELRGFDDAASRAVALAEREAGEFGHDFVGTEHLLLGLLTNNSEASARLADAGVTLAAARIKVIEAVGSSLARQAGETGPLRRTPRAGHVLGRASRFAHADGSDVVTSDHVLRGVLAVEGRAGQVLRGLGVDLAALRLSLESQGRAPAPEPRAPAPRHDGAPRCPGCNGALSEQLVCRVVEATTDSGASREAVLLSCGACGQVIGAAPA